MINYVGQQIDRYRITERLGMGGMAVVYKAYDTRLERDVAIKLIRTEEIPPSQLERLMQRFEREAKAQARFSHPHIVPAYDYGEYKGTPYLVLGYMPGGTLKERIRSGISLEGALDVILPIADAVEYAHGMGVLHRDIKPSNIIFSEKNIPMLTDFGIAKILETTDSTLTGTGLGVGTPEYMSPEQWQGKAFPASDQYALGVVLYEMLTGQKPFQAETPMAVALKQMSDPLPPPSELNPMIPEVLEKIIYKSLAREPRDRFINVMAFKTGLEKIYNIQAIEHNKFADKELQSDKQGSINHIEAGSNILQSDIDNSGSVNQSKENFQRPADLNTASKNKITSTQDIFDSLEKSALVKQKASERAVEKSRKLPRWIQLFSGLILLIIIFVIGVNLFGWDPKGLLSAALIPTEIKNVDFITATQIEKDIYLPPISTQITSSSALEEKDTEAPTKTLTPSRTPTLEPTPEFITEINPIDEVVLIYVPEGERLYPFWIYQTEVTNAQYQKCVESGKCTEKYYEYGDYGDDDHPVSSVTWYQARRYCDWSGGRLPTAAEWKKAALGTDGRSYPWGNESPSCELANLFECNNHEFVSVGSYPLGASPYGALDMIGNVYEWVEDWAEYDPRYFDGPYLRIVMGVLSDWGLRWSSEPSNANSREGIRCVVDNLP